MPLPYSENPLSRLDNPYEAPLAPLSPTVRKEREVLTVAGEMLFAVGLASPGLLLAAASVRRLIGFGATGMTAGVCLAILVPFVWMVRQMARSSRMR